MSRYSKLNLEDMEAQADIMRKLAGEAEETRAEVIAELQSDWAALWAAPVTFPFVEGDLIKTTGAITSKEWVGGVVVSINPPFFEARWSDGETRSHDIRGASEFIRVDVNAVAMERMLAKYSQTG